MIAPRGLLVLENPHQVQMGAPAGYMATVAGAGDLQGPRRGEERQLPLRRRGHRSLLVQDRIHRSPGKSIAAFLKHTGEPPGQIKVGSGGSLNRADWIDWTAPTLQ